MWRKTWNVIFPRLDLVRSKLRSVGILNEKDTPKFEHIPEDGGEFHLDLARRSLREILLDQNLPEPVRQSLNAEYQQLQEMLDRIEKEQFHIVICGRVSTGKSALLNALLGKDIFSVSLLHGETRKVQNTVWQNATTGGVMLFDTPGIDEPDGEEREKLSRQVAEHADLVLFVVDGDLTNTEFLALENLVKKNRTVLLVLNKADWYSFDELDLILHSLKSRTSGMLSPELIVSCAAKPSSRIYVEVHQDGSEHEVRRQPPRDVEILRLLLWRIIEVEGKTLTAINASLFADQVTTRLAEQIVALKRELAEHVIRTYCVGKGVAVAFNPLLAADLLAVAADGAMVVHLGRIYGLPVNTREAGELIRTILSQMILIMGAAWAVHLVSSVLKGLSGGMSTLVTASAQGAVAYYATYVVGKAAERFFSQGLSWGDNGPRQVVKEILENLDQRSVLIQARDEVLARIKTR